MEPLRALAQRFRAFLANHTLHRPKCVFGTLFSSAHFSYFTLAFFEGHGLYATAAGGLALLMVAGFLMGEDLA